MAPIDLSKQRTTCSFCKEVFATFEACHQHKVTTLGHITCRVCSSDFHSPAARQLHEHQLHAMSQNLPCGQCDKIFPRLGSLVQHLEYGGCGKVDSSVLNAVRTEKIQDYRSQAEAHKFQDYGRASSSEQPLPMMRIPVVEQEGFSKIAMVRVNQLYAHAPPPPSLSAASTGSGVDGRASSPDQPFPKNVAPVIEQQVFRNVGLARAEQIYHHAPPPPSLATTLAASSAAFVSDEPNRKLSDPHDLISFDGIIGSKWGGPDSDAQSSATLTGGTLMDTSSTSTLFDHLAQDANNFSALGAPNTAGSQGSWARNATLSPSSRAVVNPPSDLLSALAITDEESKKPEPRYNPFDPSSPGFDLKSYYINVLRKYKCPYDGCGRSTASSQAFVAHLKSPAHRQEKLLCTNCYKYFNDATALTQHIESQGTFCKVRDMDDYQNIVDTITSTIAKVEGRHAADNTIKYAINPEGILGGNSAAAVTSSVKAATKKNARDKESYWDDKKMRW